MVCAEDRNSLRLERYLQIIFGDHHGVAGRQRIRPEQLDEQLHHLRLPTGSRGRSFASAETVARPASAPELSAAGALRTSDLKRDQVRGGRFRLLVGPRRHARADPSRYQLAVGNRAIRVLRADLDAVAGLGARMVVAGETRTRRRWVGRQPAPLRSIPRNRLHPQ